MVRVNNATVAAIGPPSAVMEWVGSPLVIGRSNAAQYFLVTLAVAGLQFVWSIEQAYVTVYLLDLGLTKAVLSLVWVAGPLCGLIVQPVVGVLSDNCTSPHGRRRPFMVWGSFCVALGLLAFGWATEISARFGIGASTVAIAAVIVLDVSVNTCQACCRALIVDMFSAKRQREANGWAGRMAAIGHLASYFLGSLDLTKLGVDSQLKAACMLYSIILVICVGISAASVRERVLINDVMQRGRRGLVGHFGDMVARLWHATVELDPTLRSIFKVQLLSWYAWFTFLFYGSTYAAEVWSSSRTETPSSGEMARAGSRALSLFSLSASCFSLILPLLSPSLINLWTLSFVVYAAAILFTGLASTYTAVLIIFGVIGFSWSVTLWAPFALTATVIHQLPLNESPHDDEQVESSIEVSVPADPLLGDDEDIPDGRDEKSGVILGIHNCAITLPQFVSTFGSYVIFRLLDTDPDHPHEDGGRAIAVTLQVGAITALLAAFSSNKLRDMNWSLRR